MNPILEVNKIHCMDCLEGMRQMEDKSVDLVLTDPPYGILQGVTQIGGSHCAENRVYPPIGWDDKPSKELFDEMFRVSENQVIFGGEHLSHLLPQSRGWYCWDKLRPDNTTFSECEFVWTSFDRKSRVIRHLWHGMLRASPLIMSDVIVHPTQKPLDVVRQLLLDCSVEGDLVCDPFLGSGTTAVACKQLGRDFIGFEISQEYVDIANKRLEQEVLKSWC